VQRIDSVNTIGLSNHNDDTVADRDEIGTGHVQLSAIGQMNPEWLKAIADSVLNPPNIHKATQALPSGHVKGAVCYSFLLS
jgi:hypothetical protein